MPMSPFGPELITLLRIVERYSATPSKRTRLDKHINTFVYNVCRDRDVMNIYADLRAIMRACVDDVDLRAAVETAVRGEAPIEFLHAMAEQLP